MKGRRLTSVDLESRAEEKAFDEETIEGVTFERVSSLVDAVEGSGCGHVEGSGTVERTLDR